MEGERVPLPASSIPPGCARLIDSNGEGETFWQVSKPFVREALMQRFPQGSFSLKRNAKPSRTQHIPPRSGINLAAGETYIVKVPEKQVQVDDEPKPTEKSEESSTSEQKEEEEAKCGICLEPIKEQGVMDSCKHDFCFDCIHKWSKVTNSCPMCKAEFTKIERKGAAVAEEPSVERRRSRRLKKEPPAVVHVQPKKQKYEYTRQELEQIAGVHEEDEDERRHNPFFYPMGMGMGMGMGGMGMGMGLGMSPIQQLLLQTFPHLPPGFLASMAGVPPPPPRNHHVEDIDEDAWFDEEESEESEGEAYPSRGTASRTTYFAPSSGGSRARLRQLVSMPQEMRNAHRQNIVRGLGPFMAQPLPPRGQPSFLPNLNTLKAMFSPAFDEELLQTVLEQTGNNVDRAVEALLEMQPPEQSQAVVPDVIDVQPETANSVNTNKTSVNDKEVIVLNDDDPIEETARMPKRKYEWESSREESRNKQFSQQQQQTNTGEGRNQQKRLRLSFGEMWEGETNTQNSDEGMETNRREKEKEGSECDQELVDLAWKDFASFSRNEHKRNDHRRPGENLPTMPMRRREQQDTSSIPTTLPATTNRHHFRPPQMTNNNNNDNEGHFTGERMPQSRGFMGVRIPMATPPTHPPLPHGSLQFQRTNSFPPHGLPPHLRNSAGSLHNRGK